MYFFSLQSAFANPSSIQMAAACLNPHLILPVPTTAISVGGHSAAVEHAKMRERLVSVAVESMRIQIHMLPPLAARVKRHFRVYRRNEEASFAALEAQWTGAMENRTMATSRYRGPAKLTPKLSCLGETSASKGMYKITCCH